MGTRLQGKVAFITGAGSGIGAATALRFAQEGALVVLCGRRIEPLESVAAQIRDAGGRAECAVADVSNEAAYVGAIGAAAERNGRLDILVNNAMAYSWGAIEAPPPPTGIPTLPPRSTERSGVPARQWA